MPKKRGKKKYIPYDEAALRTLLKRLGEIEELYVEDVSTLEHIFETLEHAGERLARLAIYDLDPGVVAGAVLTLKIILDSDVLDPDLKDDFVNEAGPVLLKGIESPNVPDARKIDLVPICEHTGYLSPQDDLSQYFEDLAGTMNRTMASTMDKFVGEPAEIGNLLFSLWDSAEGQEMPEAMFLVAMEMARHSAVKNSAGASALAAATFLMGYEELIGEETLEASFLLLENLNDPESVWWLNALADWPCLEEWNDRARRAAAKRRLSGIKPHTQFSRTFSHAQITAWDGSDSRQLSLYFHTPEGGCDALSFLIKADDGFRDMFIVAEEGAKVGEAIDEMENGGISIATCSWDQAMEYLADACAINLETQDMLPALLFSMLPYFPNGLPKPARRRVSLSAYDLSSVTRSPEMVAESLFLLSGPVALFQFSSDAAYAYLRLNKPSNAKKLSKKWILAFLDALEEAEKPSLLFRLETLLEVEALAGRAMAPYTRILLNTWIALKEDIVPFSTILLVNELAKISVPVLLENIRLGFTTQAEANRFFNSLNSDEPYWDDEEFSDEFGRNDK